jgi:copper chaperone NosL
MKFSAVIVVVFGIAMMIVLANCQSATLEPIAIEPNDMCAFCRMSISEKRYAAELIGEDGEASKFDDIGCMANFKKQKKNDDSIRASFVMDFETREWLKAEDAFYVRSSEFKTPMSGGIVAFKHESNAQAAAAKYQGAMLRFAEVTK